jgi:hypothetical protein
MWCLPAPYALTTGGASGWTSQKALTLVRVRQFAETMRARIVSTDTTIGAEDGYGDGGLYEPRAQRFGRYDERRS